MPSNPGLYDAVIPTCIAYLRLLTAILTKAEDHCKATNTPFDKVFPQASLAPDMYTLPYQIYLATEICQKMVSRFHDGSIPALGFDDKAPEKDTSAADLHARVDKALVALESCSAEEFEKGEYEELTWAPRPGIDIKGPKRNYVLVFCMPNIAFHVVTTYNILRHRGVQLGKIDVAREFFGVFLPEANLANVQQ